MKKTTYEVGDMLCDMHDGFQYLPDNLKMVSHIIMQDETALQLANAFVKSPINKYLYVVGEVPFTGNIVAVYQYDGIYFGMAELKYTMPGA